MLSESGMLEEMKVIVQQRNVVGKLLIAQQYETRARRISDQREGCKRLGLRRSLASRSKVEIKPFWPRLRPTQGHC